MFAFGYMGFFRLSKATELQRKMTGIHIQNRKCFAHFWPYYKGPGIRRTPMVWSGKRTQCLNYPYRHSTR